MTPDSYVLPRPERERRAAAYEWLLTAAPDRQTAISEWRSPGVALLTAGVEWDAVRVPYDVLHPGFDRATTLQELVQRLGELKVGGSAFCDPYRPFMYLLVPPRTDKDWPRDLASARVECLGGTQPYVHHVGVPRLESVAPPGPFWLTPPDVIPQRHADPEHLYAVLHALLHAAPQQQADTPQVIV
ncbi:hypothetical protein [Streptomyces cadmiisoli]|uniref:hypothetical protein n=1 Tax=Streptomyces cadmiisoli TaxID=2184053 RepID=UPI00364D2E7C